MPNLDDKEVRKKAIEDDNTLASIVKKSIASSLSRGGRRNSPTVHAKIGQAS